MQRNHITIDGLDISYVRAGNSGRTIVCFHGLGASTRYFEPLIQELATSYTVFSPDQPDFGKSSDTGKKLSIDTLAEFYQKFIDQLELNDCVLIGNSMGCQVIATLISNNPAIASSAVLIGPTVNPHERSVPKQLWRWLQDGRHEPSSGSTLMRRDFKDAGVLRVIKTLRHTINDKIEDKLPHITVPVLIIRGANDTICPQDWMEEAVALLPRGELGVIQDAAHAVHYAKPKETATLINDFLAQQREL